MRFQSRTIIEIADHAVKIFQAPLKGNGALSFSQCLSFSTMSDEAISNFFIDVQKNKKMLPLINSEVILVVPRQQIMLRYLDLPSEKTEELKAMVDLRVSKELPFSREEIVVDFIALDKKDGYTKVLVVAILIEHISRLINILSMANIKPTRAVPSFVGIWHWYKTYKKASEGVAVILDIDHYQSEICLCDDKRVFVSRPTSLGMAEIKANAYEEFLQQLDWTIAGYVKEQLGISPSQILIMHSSLEEVAGLFAQVKSQYSASVTSIFPLKEMQLQKNIVWPQVVLDEGVSLTAILGLLHTRNNVTIDLIPAEVKEREVVKNSKKQSVRLAIALIIALSCIYVSFSLDLFKKNKILSDIEGSIAQTQKKVVVIDQKRRQVDFLRATLNKRVVVIDLIDEVYQLLPSGVVLTNLTIDKDNNMSFQGYTSRAGDVNQMQQSFVASNYFDDVNLDYVNKRVAVEGELNYFRITCQVKLSQEARNEEAR